MEFPSGIIGVIREQYPFATKAEFVERVAGGFLSNNFIIQNGNEKLFLKQYRFDAPAKIEEIHRIKFFLANGGIPVILPLAGKDDNYYFKHNNRYYSLFPFVDGKIIKRIDRSPKAFASAGAMLARIHALSRQRRLNLINEQYKGWDRDALRQTAQAIEARIKSIARPTSFDSLAAEALALKQKLAQKNNLRLDDLGLSNDHIVHGDYHGQNIFFDDHDEVKYVFDLEKTELAPRVTEIARSMDFMCFSNDYAAKNFAAANNYLRAYNEIYPLTKDELASGIRAYFIKKAHSLWIEKEHYLNSNPRVDCLLEGEIKMLAWYSLHIEDLISATRINL